ncbi:transaldolase [Candidatus Pantoea edessiphila]|uniref:Transaldolase n=1 Tax=Candidatus Pantoea edessiphila TaxID=2044610 RepID=A0A2P5T0Y6_9GAMM|nr:transaldolase [Candidatus Pantoea edessiphila]PPI88248.1 transaldolase [Candidatus Pantoea edessiphila]
MNQLESLKKFTTVVIDSSDIQSIQKYHPEDATTNPAIILRSVKSDSYKFLVNDAINYAKKQGGSKEVMIVNASDKIAVNIGTEILKYIPGRISTEIDSRLSFNTIESISKAKKLINMYKANGIEDHRILIKLAATWEGIRAAEEIEKNGIKCNLTLIFSVNQARACAEANVFLISPFVGRIYDWHNKQNFTPQYLVDKDPGVKLIKDIYNYYKNHQYKTIIMGASFRRIEQIIALAGCDYLTISPILLKELQNNYEPLTKKLKLFFNKVISDSSLISESEFRWEHNQNPMAVEKLSEGIRQFSIDQYTLDKLIASKF